MPLLSVVLPAYNAERFVGVALRSMLAQTLRNIEIIAIDDGSTDATLKELCKAGDGDPRVTIVSRENRGLVATLNEGIERACGHWVARMDADDEALPDRLQRQLAWMERTGAAICGTWAVTVGAGRSRPLRHPVSDSAIRTELLFGSCFIHPSVVMETDAVRSLRYREEMARCEDHDLWERAAADGLVLANVPEALLRYRIHRGQESQRHRERQAELSQVVRRRAWTRFLTSRGSDPTLADDVASIRDPGYRLYDLDRVESAFRLLLAESDVESRAVALDHVGRLCLRIAGRQPEIVGRWRSLWADFGGRSGGRRLEWQMDLVAALRLDPERPAFQHAKRWYQAWSR